MALSGRFKQGVARLLTPYLVLTFGVTLTAATGFYVYESNRARDEARFTALVNEVEDAIDARIGTYTAILRSARGYVVAQPRFPTYHAFEAFASQIGLESHYHGALGIGYSIRMASTKVPALERFAQGQGFTGFHVWPRTPGRESDAILYLYPLDRRNRAALGFNMGSEARRREAMNRARDSGAPAATARVTLVQEIDVSKQAGFLIYVPVYQGRPVTVEERRRSLLGYIYSPFRGDDLLREIARNLALIDFTAYDGATIEPDALLHRSADLLTPLPGDFHPAYHAQRTLNVAGRPWTLEFTSRPAFERSPAVRPAAAAALIGLLFTFVLYALSRSLYQAWYASESGAAELRESQAALTSRERELDTLVRNTPDIVTRFDRSLKHLFVNQSVETSTGIPAAAFLGKTNREIGFPERVVDLWEGAITRVFTSAQPAEIEFSFASADGVNRFFQSRLVPEFGEDGEVRSVLSVARDITGLKEAEERVRRTAGRMELLAEISNDFAAAQLDMRAVAQRAVRFLAGPVADVAVLVTVDDEGKAIVPLALAHVDSATEERMYEVMAGRPVAIEGGLFGTVIQSGEALLVSKFDSRSEAFGPVANEFFATHPINSVMMVPLKVSGRTIGAIGAGLIGAQAAFGAEDQDIIRDLADRAALALENARLYDEARRAIRMRDEFLSIASHELKTPLTPLQLQVQNLQRLATAGSGQLSPERLRAFAATTDRQVQRLTGLVNSLLDVSRIGAGKFELEAERFDLAAAVRDVIERFSLEAERTGTEFRLQAPNPVVGTWDRMRIEQVITNLVSNALKYGERKPVDVYCGVAAGWAELRVVDHGIGLPADFADRAFERYTRGVSARSYGGLGLGLYIVKQIVLAHGGQVAARTSEEGTVFTVRLPA